MRRQRGVAMVVVLWTLVLLSAIAVSYATTVRSELRIARNHVEQAQAALLAEAGIARARFELRRRLGEELDDTGTARHWQEESDKVTWGIRNAAGLVDINAAGDALLDRLLAPVVTETDRRDALVDAIQDWRDSDDLRRLAGAEGRDYRAAGRETGPRNAPFAHPAELRQVLGMTPAIVDAIRPYVVTEGGLAGVNPRYASPALLRWLGLGTDAEIAAYVAARQADEPGVLPGRERARAALASGRSEHYRLEASGRVGERARARLTALWHGGSGQETGDRLLAWDRGNGEGGDDGD